MQSSEPTKTDYTIVWAIVLALCAIFLFYFITKDSDDS